MGFLIERQIKYIEMIRTSDISYANAARHIPLPDGSVEVLYSSHMLEHLIVPDVPRFLAEARRVLAFDGVLRLAVPDLRILAQTYLQSGNADAFISKSLLTNVWPMTRTWQGKIRLALVGDPSSHKWMYDGPSLCALLQQHGFREPVVQPAGATRIANPGALNLRERESDSVYVEALR